jgi:hypothetical protein
MEEDPKSRFEGVQVEVCDGDRRLGGGEEEAVREPMIERGGPE